MKLTEVIEALQKKVASLPPDVEVEGILCTDKGMLIFADVALQGQAIKNAVSIFEE